MATLVYADGIVTVRLSYTSRKADGSLFYQRRVPKDLREHYGSPLMPRRSLGGLTPVEAAKRVAAYVKQDEAEWASIRAHPSTPEHIKAKVDVRLAKWRADAPERYPDEAAPTEAEHLGEVLDDFLTSEYGNSYHDLKMDSRIKGRDFEAALRSRVSAVDYETFRRVMALRSPSGALPLLSRVLEEYLSAKGDAFQKKSGMAVRRALGIVYSTVGDRPLGEYTRDHAKQVRDALLASGLRTTSARRRLNDIRTVYNSGRVEFDLRSLSNPFEDLKIKGENTDAGQREPFTAVELAAVASACRDRDDDGAWIAAILLETGARLAEVVGLRREDVFLRGRVPHVWIRPHASVGRSLKTAASVRKVPLVGVALWAVQRVPEGPEWLFPRYAKDGEVKAGAASARLNPWIKEVSASAKTCHSFRHAMKDRLRSAEVPEDIQQALVGHGTKSVSRRYGEGYPLDILSEYMRKVCLSKDASASSSLSKG